MRMIGAPMRRGAMLAVLVVAALPGVSRGALTWSAPVSINDQQQTSMTAVACPATFQCIAVDAGGMEVRFNPVSPQLWSAYSVDRGQELTGVACPTTSQCTAVDIHGSEVTFNPAATGGSMPFAIDPGNSLYGIACPSAAQCTAVDSVGQEITFDPTVDRGPVTTQIGVATQIGSGVLPAIACPSTTQCTAVDSGYAANAQRIGSGQLITFDPTSPGQESSISVTFVGNGIACPSLTECVATTTQFCMDNCAEGLTVTFDPTSTETPTPMSRSRNEYFSLACSSVSQCAAMEMGGNEVTFDPTSAGTSSEAQIDTVGMLREGQIACPSASLCAAVADTVGGAEWTFDPAAPGKPTEVLIDDSASNLSLSCPAAFACFALARVENPYLPGPIGAVATLHNGSGTNPSSLLVAIGNPGGFSCPTASQCTIVTRRTVGFGTPCCKAVTFDPHGGTTLNFRVGRLIDSVDLTGLFCPTRNQCTAIDVRGREVTFNPHRPSQHTMRALAPSALTSVVCMSVSQCVAVDRAGQAVTFDPRTGLGGPARRIDGRLQLVSVSCPNAIQCTAIDGHGFEVTFSPAGTPAAISRRIDTNQLTAVSCPTQRFCVAVDTAGRALAGNPLSRARWTTATLPGAGPLLSVSCPTSRLCVAVDADGHAYTGRA